MLSDSDRQGAASRSLVMRLSLLAIAVVLVLFFLVMKGEQDDDSVAEIDPEAVFVPAPVPMAPRLYLLGALSPSVAYVVETDDGLILVDAGLAGDHQLLLEQLQHLHLEVHDLKLILLTHAHGDHYLGAQELRQLTGAKIYAGRDDSSVIRDAGPREAVFSTFPMDHVHIHPTDVDAELAGGELIELGDARIRAIATPGHTPGSMCYLLERGGLRALFSGDTIMTITGDLGTYSTYLPPRYRGDARAYLTSLRALQQLPAPDLLLPGHPRTDVGMISARITPQQWTTLLGQGIAAMEQLIAHYNQDGADFLDGNPKELLPGLLYLGEFSGVAIYGFVHESSVIVFDAPGGPELLGFLEERLGDVGLSIDMLKAVALTGTSADATSGLSPLVDRTGCQVIVARSDLEKVQGIAPTATLLPAETAVSELDWIPLQPVSVAGFVRHTAYRIEWAGKRVLVSGNASPQSFASVPEIRPDLWLPAKPVHGQNANLYGDDWQNAINGRRL